VNRKRVLLEREVVIHALYFDKDRAICHVKLPISPDEAAIISGAVEGINGVHATKRKARIT